MGKVAFVTGGSRGIGRAIVIALAKAGFRVAFTYRANRDQAEKIAEEMRQVSSEAYPIQMDQTARNSVRLAVHSAVEHFGEPPLILINNAAMAQEKPFEGITDADWEQMLRVNLQGPFICAQEVLQAMREAKWGRIINISSIGGQWGGFNQVHYAASKAGLINLTRSLAKIYSGEGILSNAIAVGLAKTDMSANELARKDGKEKVAGIPMGRVADLSEIANAVLFLCSDDSSYISGQTLNLNGGMYFG